MTNICRCGAYQRIRAAIHQAAGSKHSGSVWQVVDNAGSAQPTVLASSSQSDGAGEPDRRGV